MYTAARDLMAVENPWCGPSFFTAVGQRERITSSRLSSRARGFVITVDGAVAGHLSLDGVGGDVLRSADLGYWLAPWLRRQGAGSQAIALAAEHAFRRLGLDRLHATVDQANTPSRRALERNGFVLVGLVPVLSSRKGDSGDRLLYQLAAPGRMAVA